MASLTTPKQEQRREKSTLFWGITWYDIIGLLIILGVRMIPAPEPLTQAGMQVIATMLGVAFIFSTVGSTWGVFLGWMTLAAPAKALGVNGAHAIWAVASITMGDWLVLFILLSCLLCYALKVSGFMAHFAHWFMNLKFAKKGPWSFLVAWMAMSFILGFFIETITVCMFLLSVAYSIFERAGFKAGEKYPGCIVIGTVLASLCAYVCTPIGFGAGYKGMALAIEALDGNLHMIEYMIMSLPGAIAAFFVIYLLFRYVVKPDTSKMEGANYTALIGEKPAPLDNNARFTIVIYMLVMFFWIVPSFCEMWAPDWAVTKWMSEQTSVGFALMGLIAMCLIKIDGRPLLDLKKGLQNIPWSVVLVMATSRGVATLIGKSGTGFNDYVSEVLAKLGGMPSWLLIALVCLVLALATQFASNTPITALGVAVLVPQAALLGCPTATTAILVVNAAGLAMTLPSGFAFLGYLAGDEWNLKGPQLGIGTAAVLTNFVFLVTVTYALGFLFF